VAGGKERKLAATCLTPEAATPAAGVSGGEKRRCAAAGVGMAGGGTALRGGRAGKEGN